MDDGLHIKPPQPHHRHKDRKRDRGHRHSQKSSRNNKDVPLTQGTMGVVSGGSGERRQHERRHHHRDEDQRPRHREVERIERKERYPNAKVILNYILKTSCNMNVLLMKVIFNHLLNR